MVLMVKKVKLVGDGNVLEMDEVDNYDSLSLDGASQGEGTMASQDVSDFEDDPKSAPARLHFGQDRCFKLFQLSKDIETGVIQVCGGLKDCKRNGHKWGTDLGDPGMYETIKTQNYVDGILSSYCSLEEQKKLDIKHKAMLDEVASQLTGSKNYQQRLKAAEDELYLAYAGGKGRSDGMTDEEEAGDEWDDNIEEEELKLPTQEVKRELRHSKDNGTKTKGGIKGEKKTTAAPEATQADVMAHLVLEVKEALKDMAVSMGNLAKTQRKGQGSTTEARRRTLDPESEESSEEESNPKSRKTKASNKATARKMPGGKQKCYYAVARGRIPGVYTDWGQAERQVNGFSGSLHKKFKDRFNAQRFVDSYRNHGDAESEDSSGVSGSDPEGFSGDESPKAKSHRTLQGQEGRRKHGGEGFPPLEITAPDPSTGNSKELFKMTLGGDQHMIEKLSPPGLDVRTREALADATLDAIQLPGMSHSETADSTGDLVGALREMTEDWRYDWTSDRPQKDSLWKAASRTSLLTIKSEEGLCERLTEFAGLPEEMFENQVHKFSAIFSKLHWGPESIHAWSCCNWFLRIGKDTLENYVALHLHLVTHAIMKAGPMRKKP
jgi:hypothetical protein